MSDTDSFIEEVTEEVRRDQLYKYVRKYGWIAIALVVGVVGVTGYLEYQKVATANAAQALGDKLVAALDEKEPAARAAALADVAPDAGAAQVVVEMRRAGELIQAGDIDAAIAAFEGVANSGADPIYADMAQLKALILRGEDQEATERDAVLAQLAAPGALYRPLALEQQGLIALAGDDQSAAIEIFTELFQDSEITDGLRNRATQMLVALGAELPSAPVLLSE
ncbi:MAG: tetratricopeptide repeat protein [Amylibacter sp.]|nr:tetratricopeptide repeat protein [Amylibacter sp.]